MIFGVIGQVDGSVPLASGTLEIQGIRLTLHPDDVAQVVNVGEQARVRTCYTTAAESCGNTASQAGGVSGFEVRAELRGPELPMAVPVQTVAGGTFLLPSFQQEGDYRLENIRLVDPVTNSVVESANPAVAMVHVRQIVLSHATVTRLSLEDLESRGIAIGQENFQAFDFAVGFAFGGVEVNIELPVLYQGGGEVGALGSPTVVLDGLPPEVAKVVARWQPPRIVPFTLEIPAIDILDSGDEPYAPITFPVFGAIVMPGSVAFLNQFFDATMIVANGAPQGTGIELRDLSASLRLPNGNVLRVANTEPPVAAGQKVPMIAGNGSRVVAAGNQASATWTVEGLVAGTHVLRMDVEGELIRPGREAVPVTTIAQAAVEVVDARFHLVFSHPDVVREGSPYTLFVTVTNLSRVDQYGISIEISDEHITSAHKAESSDDFIRRIDELGVGESETIEYRLVADLTGQVVGGTFESNSSMGSGAIQLYTGVGELGIPLSPATLRLPRFSERLAAPHVWTDDYHTASVRFLGLAYSLAIAPSGLAPAGLPHVIRSDVEERAIDLGFAGQRTFLGENLLETLEVLLLDQLGNRKPLAEIDQLRRTTDKGLETSVQLARLLRYEQEVLGLDAIDLFDHFAETTSYARPYLAAMLLPIGGNEVPILEIRKQTAMGRTFLARTGEEEEPLRSLAFGEVFAIDELAVGAGGRSVPLAVIGHVEPDEHHLIYLHNQGDVPAEGRLLLLVLDSESGGYRRMDFGVVRVPARTVIGVTTGGDIPDPVDGGFEFFEVASGTAVAGITTRTTDLVLPPFRIVGAQQDYLIGAKGSLKPNLYGQGVSYLFNRPPAPDSVEEASAFRVRSTFTDGASGQEMVSEKTGLQAFLQPSERVVNVRFSSPISALWDAQANRPLVDHEHLIDELDLVDGHGESLATPIPEPLIEYPPQHLGGLVAGSVLRGTGVPAANARVQLIRPRLVDTLFGYKTVLDVVGEMVTGADGRFYFDMVEQPHFDPSVQDEFTLRAFVPEGSDPATEPAAVEEVSSTIRQQNQVTNINIALLGRGTVTGHLLYSDNGEPVLGGMVTVASTLFNDSRTVEVDAAGAFEVLAMPVGPLTVIGRDTLGRVVYATVGLERPGGVVDVLLELARTQPPGLGTVVGTVSRQSSEDPASEPQPIAGATVEVMSKGASLGKVVTGPTGTFHFPHVPAGQVTVQAADWRISRTSVLTDLILAADETVELNLVIPVSSTRSVAGRVVLFDAGENIFLPVANAPVFIEGPGVFSHTDADGEYLIQGVPVQAAGESPYAVSAIDYDRGLQGTVELPLITGVSDEVIAAQPIVLREMRGGIDGVVLDPLGRPVGGAGVVASFKGVPYFEINSRADGSFSFSDLPLGEWGLTAHFGDGLAEGKIGYFGTSGKVNVVFGGHRPFSTIRMVGSGLVNLQVSSGQQSSVWAEVYYRPTYFSEATNGVTLKGVAVETETDPNGFLQLVLPVGSFEISVFSPFHGVRTVGGFIAWSGQVKTVDVVFDGSSTVIGQLVNVDGTTPIPDFEVELHAHKLLPQKQRTDAEGRFRFELVPEGALEVRAEGVVGSVTRVGKAGGSIGSGGQTLELTVRMKAQGMVEGTVMERVGASVQPLANSQVYVQEESYPFRRLPSSGGWYATDAEGRYQVSHVFAGNVRVVARDAGQVTRLGSSQGRITEDWQVVRMPDIILATSVGSIAMTVRDPETGATLPDSQVTIRGGSGQVDEMTVADSAGIAIFDALPLYGYSITAFHAPTGRTGRIGGLVLSEPGQHLQRTVYVDQRGAVGGTLFDDIAKTLPVAGATVELRGETRGGSLTALDTTSGRDGELGRFDFLGIPEGTFSLEAGTIGSPRRASAELSLTATAPVAEIDLVLEPAGNLSFRVMERLSTGLAEVDTQSIQLSARLEQRPAYDFTLLQPAVPSPGHLLTFPNVLLDRRGTLSVRELGGEQRSAGVTAANFTSGIPLSGSGDESDPYQIVLGARGVVRIQVLDAASLPVAQANVTLVSSGGGRFPSTTGSDGMVTFTAVPAGDLNVSASAPLLGVGGRNTGVLQFDDDLIEIVVRLQASVSAHGVVYQPVPGDVYDGDPSTLVPQAGATVTFDFSGGRLFMTTGDAGFYQFDALPEGSPYTVTARTIDGQSVGSVGGTLLGPNGNDNQIPPLILDGGPPQIISIVPPPGMEEVSRTAVVEILFSEPLLASVVPAGQPTSPYFELVGPSGLAVGSWLAGLDGEGRQIVRFDPSTPYDNKAVYSLKIRGGTGGVRDRSGRPLTQTGDVGSTFTTSDGIGPAVIGTSPVLDRPVEGFAPIRFDFNESVIATDEQLDGDGVGDTAVLSWGRNDGGGGIVWQPLPTVLFLTRNNYSLTVDPVEGLDLVDDSLLRRIEILGIEDSKGNEMTLWERDYRIRDDNAPVIDELPPPPNAPDAQLIAGSAYTITPVVSGIDNYPLDPPQGDLDRVEYFFNDPAASGPTASPGFTASTPPYEFSFVAAYAGNGIDTRPFPIWARAVDTSSNASDVVELAMEVLPNQAPVIGEVTVEALAPVAGVFFAGSSIRATVAGFADPDGSQLSLAVELRVEGGGIVDLAPTLLISRPASGDWTDLDPPTRDLKIPMAPEEGANLYLQATATDTSGSSVTVESTRFAVADDQGDPIIEGVTFRSVADGEPKPLFHIGQQFYIEFTARDAETEVVTVDVAFDRSDVFPLPPTAARVSGDLFRTDALTVPIDAFSEVTTVEASLTAFDRGGNQSLLARAFEVGPEPDPTAPTVEWLTPWDGGAWPSDYSSVLSPGVGVSMLLRVGASDLSTNDTGDIVPGNIVSVMFRGPVADGNGGLELAADPVAASVVAGTEGAGSAEYQAMWQIPDGIPTGTEVPFEVRVVDSGGLDVVTVVRLEAVAYKGVFEGVQTAVLADESLLAVGGDERGAVFLLGGTTLSIYPPSDGSLRSVDALYLYAGASVDGGLTVQPTVLTAPPVTSYASAIPFHPLLLEIRQFMGVGVETRIDVSLKGLLGSTSSEKIDLPGVVHAQRRAGGSHGGAGWFGAPDQGWQGPFLYQPSDTYDSVRAPHLPGVGGGGSWPDVGGTGGGVVNIEAGNAVVHLVGDVRADGGGSRAGAGAGGTIRLNANRIEGQGRMTAVGGASQDRWRAGGGGGGRIALLYRELGGGFDPEAQTDAGGGGNGGAFFAGAGTRYFEQLDPISGAASGVGTLSIASPASLPAGPTFLPAVATGQVSEVSPLDRLVMVAAAVSRSDVTGDNLVLSDGAGQEINTFEVLSQVEVSGSLQFEIDATEAELDDLATRIGAGTVFVHTRARFAHVRGAGSARLVFDGDLEVGEAEAPQTFLNDADSLDLASGARALLRSQGPENLMTAAPEPGSDVIAGSSIAVQWSSTNPIGLWEASTTWPTDNVNTLRRYPDHPLSAVNDPDPVRLSVPGTATPGSAAYSLEVVDIAGRAVATEMTWNIVPDVTLPTIGIELSPLLDNDTYIGGDAISIRVTAADDVRVVSLSLTYDGVTSSTSGAPITRNWVAPPVEVVETQDVEVTATDSAGNVATTTRTITIQPEDETGRPTVRFQCPTSFATLPAGYDNLVLSVLATDNEDVAQVEFFVGDEETPFSTYDAPGTATEVVASSSPTSLLSVPGVARFRARAYDRSGYMRETAVDIEVIEAIRLDPAGANDWAALEDQVVYMPEGTLVLDEPRTFAGLLVLNGGVITHSECVPGSEASLDLTVNGPVFLECGGALDVSGKGYGSDTTYPGATQGPPRTGGSHIGQGSISNYTYIPGSTFGSVTQPRECGAGGVTDRNPGALGGGVIRLVAESMVVEATAEVRSESGPVPSRGGPGAGGSIWITVAGGITGFGSISARGLESGGGAVALEYSWIDPEVRENTSARSDGTPLGGAGSVYLLDLSAAAGVGDLIVENWSDTGTETVLPSLGGGVAGVGSSASILDTGIAEVERYFVGHWVRVTDPLAEEGDRVKGVWRIGGVAGSEVTLVPNKNGEQISVVPGDLWQGLYRFDNILVTSGASLSSADPIEVIDLDVEATIGEARFEVNGVAQALAGASFEDAWIEGGLEVVGEIEVASIHATNMTLFNGSSVGPIIRVPISIDVEETLEFLGNAEIDLTRRGFLSTRPVGAARSYDAGGSHMGLGSQSGYGHDEGTPGTTFGSVTRPFEFGGEGFSGSYGGSAVRITAKNLRLPVNSSIHSDGDDGGYSDNGGAGGSIWISVAEEISGSGRIQARGGPRGYTTSSGSGGGGAIAIACQTLDPEIRLNADGSFRDPGGAGTIVIRKPDNTFGDLLVDSNRPSGTVPYTALPGIGFGVAADGSRDAILVTDRAIGIADFFVGHWVEIRNQTGEVKGIWQIGSVDGTTATLTPNSDEEISIEPGDGWQGVYRFDSVNVIDLARLTSGDRIDTASMNGPFVPYNDAAPVIDITAIQILAGNGAHLLESSPGAIVDSSGIKAATITNLRTGYREALEVQDDGSFMGIPLDGIPGDLFRLYVADAHPMSLATMLDIGPLVGNAGPPTVVESLLEFIRDPSGAYHLIGPAGSVTDSDFPIFIGIVNPANGTDAGGEANIDGSFEFVIDASAGDTLTLTAVDGHPDPLATEIDLVVPDIAILEVEFEIGSVVVDEDIGVVELGVVLSSASYSIVSVGFWTAPGDAFATVDFVEAVGVVEFAAGETRKTIQIEIVDDSDVEGEETFSVELYDPAGAFLGAQQTVEIGIVSDDTPAVKAVFSVGVGVGNMLSAPVGIDIAGGAATFDQELPEAADRGDRVEIDGVGPVYLGFCASNTVCEVFDGSGLPAGNVTGASASSIYRAFESLQEAMIGAGDADHLDTTDLASIDRSLEILCYGGPEDTTPVIIDGWTTSPTASIRIMVPTAADRRGPSQRHEGRWDGQDYRLEVIGDDCIRSTVGNITFEGLQLFGSGDPNANLAAIRLDGIDGDVVVSEVLIRMDGAVGDGERFGVVATASTPVAVAIRNSVIYDLGGGSDNHAGIVSEDPGVSTFAANNTIYGGTYGIRAFGGTLTAVNNLVVDSETACFAGDLDPSSTKNLATDSSAPGTPPLASGQVAVTGPLTGPGADFHLECSIEAKISQVLHNFGTNEWRQALDGNHESIFISQNVNPAEMTVVFDQQQIITGSAVEFSNCESHTWQVEAADSLADLDQIGASYRLIVPSRTAVNTERVWEGVDFGSPETVGALRLTVQRNCGGSYVHLNEWQLSGHNPACQEGVDLAGHPEHPFSHDVDSIGRSGAWDIGADQDDDVTVSFRHGPSQWWELEGEALVQVVLSKPSSSEVKVRWQTLDNSAVAGEDYDAAQGELTFAPGEVSQVIAVSITDDGAGDDGEGFVVALSDPVGAKLGSSGWWVQLREGTPPVRVRLAQPVWDANEGNEEAVVVVELSRPHTEEVTVQWDAISNTAYIGPDFVNPGRFAVIPAGETQVSLSYDLVDDSISETAETFVLKSSWLTNAEPGVPAIGFVRIVDDDTTKRRAVGEQHTVSRRSTRSKFGPAAAARSGDGQPNSGLPLDPQTVTVFEGKTTVRVMVPTRSIGRALDGSVVELHNPSIKEWVEFEEVGNGLFLTGVVPAAPGERVELRVCPWDDARDCSIMEIQGGGP